MRAIPHPITNCGADEGLVGSPKQGAAQNPAMKTPARLQPLLDEGLIDEVLRQLMSGKEAKVYVVRCGDELLAAKVYKEAERRSFHQAVDYTENRKVKNWLRHVTKQRSALRSTRSRCQREDKSARFCFL